MSFEQIKQNIEKLEHYVKFECAISREDKSKQIKKQIDQILSQLPEQPSRDLSIREKAKIWYYKGKTLESYPEYNKEAEECLSKAVKLDPSIVDAWNTLGHCFWKKEDLTSAKSCYSTALSLSPNKVSLRELSRIIRIENTENIQESIDKARKAVSMDVKDAESWYVLGNAYLSWFMGSLRIDDLHKALKAYNQAEINYPAPVNPDLYFNRAMLHKYQEEYQKAFYGFSKSYELDPSLTEGKQEADDIIQLFSKIKHIIETKANKSEIEMDQYIQCIPIDASHHWRNSVSTVISQLKPDVQNKKSSIAVRVIETVSKPGSLPMICMVIDKQHTIVPCSIFHVVPDTINSGDVLAIVDVHVHQIQFKSETVEINTLGLQVQNPTQVIINGMPISRSKITVPSVSVSTFSY